MVSTRRTYSVDGTTLNELIMSLNFALSSIADRLDKIEGIRGGSSIESDLDMNNKTIENVSIDATEILTESLAIDVDGETIHSME